MIKLRYQLSTLMLLLLFMGCVSSSFAQNLEQVFPQSIAVELKNPLQQKREEVMIFLPEKELLENAPSFNANAFVVLDGDKEVPSQYITEAGRTGVAFVLDQLQALEERAITVRYAENGEIIRDYPKRTQAELSHKEGGYFKDRKYVGGEFKNVDSLRVPDEHTDHSYYIRYEGPGWESDKVGYHFYLDWRNGIDAFGKTTNEMVLQQVGLDGFDSYHELQDWGMDILKVGKALGVGSIALFHNGQANRIDETDSLITAITENGPVYSSIKTNYYGWKVANQQLDIQSLLSIHAGSRLTHNRLEVEGDNPENLSTGLTKDSSTELYKSKGGGKAMGYLATYGQQSLNKDNVGLAVLFHPADFSGFTEDEFSHVVKLKPSEGKLDYYFLAAWELEEEGITNEQQFMEYLNKKASELAQPVEVKFVK